MLNTAILALFLTIFGSISHAQPVLLDALKKSEKWLMPANGCPVDVINNRILDSDVDQDICKNNEVKCLNSCQEGQASYCYNLALEVQTFKNKALNTYSEALFLRACKLGILSGCTNRAAGIDLKIGEKSPDPLCSVNTYKKICELGDPWSCTMYGYHLATGKLIKQDFNKALKVMANSCKYGVEDPACTMSKRITQEIESLK